MKLLRYGDAGAERPGILDSTGQIRDLSAILPDISGPSLSPQSLNRLRQIDHSTLPSSPPIPVSVPASPVLESSSALVSTTPITLPNRARRYLPSRSYS